MCLQQRSDLACMGWRNAVYDWGLGDIDVTNTVHLSASVRQQRPVELHENTCRHCWSKYESPLTDGKRLNLESAVCRMLVRISRTVTAITYLQSHSCSLRWSQSNSSSADSSWSAAYIDIKSTLNTTGIVIHEVCGMCVCVCLRLWEKLHVYLYVRYVCVFMEGVITTFSIHLYTCRWYNIDRRVQSNFCSRVTVVKMAESWGMAGYQLQSSYPSSPPKVGFGVVCRCPGR